MRYVLFTDIHSCASELKRLVAKVELRAGDVLAGFSDLFDKGPDPAGTMKIIQELSSKFPFHMVIGNHCWKNFRFRKKLAKDYNDAMKMKRSAELKANTDILSASDIELLNKARFYFIMPEFDSILVHAGIPPVIKNLPQNKTLGELSKKETDFYNQLWFTRYVNPAGFMVPLNQQTEEDKFWTEVYDGRFGTVFYGHQPQLGAALPAEINKTVGFDLGCVYGGKLTAIILDCDTKKVSYVSVDAESVYTKSEY
jgi:hypothetical protein